MKLVVFAALLAALVLPATAALAADKPVNNPYVAGIEQWRKTVEQGLKRDNGWLTLAGRYVMKPGTNTIGTGADNDIVLPPGLGPARLGQVVIDGATVTLKLAEGLTLKAQEGQFSGERVMQTSSETRDWVSLGRMAFHVIERKGTYVLRLADNESAVRKNFAGRLWYGVDERYRVSAQYVPYPPGRTMQIIDVIDELHDMPSPGYLEFQLAGKTYRLDAVGEEKDKDLFVILKDQTAGKGTYNAGRFLAVEWPDAVRKTGGKVTIDFNKTYNPPCAFSEFTTCPLPPSQNQLPTKIEAGEKYRLAKN